MAYMRPNAFQRTVFDKLAMRFGLSGAQTLETTGWRSGRPYRVPVIPVDYQGGRYLVSTRGDSPWVHNLRSSGSLALNGRQMRASELSPPERPPVIEAYRKRAGRAVDGYWRRLPDPKDHPVFRLDT
jgi:hypothetical protein